MKKIFNFLKEQSKNLIIIVLLLVIAVGAHQYSKVEYHSNSVLQYRQTNARVLSELLHSVYWQKDINVEIVILRNAEIVLKYSEYPFQEELLMMLKNLQVALEIKNGCSENIDSDQLEEVNMCIFDISYLIYPYGIGIDVETEQEFDAYYDKKKDEIMDKIEYINHYCEYWIDGN